MAVPAASPGSASSMTRRGPNAETATMKAVLEAMRHLGIMAWRQNPIAAPLRVGERVIYRSNASGMSGMSDIGGVCPGGRFIAVEVKGHATRLKPQQILYLDNVTRIGGIAMVVRSVDEFMDAVLRGANGSVKALSFTWYGVSGTFEPLSEAQRSALQAAVVAQRAKKRRR